MPRDILNPNFGPWEAEKDWDEEVYDIKHRIDDYKALCKPPEEVSPNA